MDHLTLLHQLKLYFIMGSPNVIGNPVEALQQAIEGGITIFQYREKGKNALTGIEKSRLGHQLRMLCADHDIPFIVNDDVQLAIELEADGVHVGQDDEAVKRVRDKIGHNKIIGVSSHTLKEANQAVQDEADYLGVGPIFATSTKLDTFKVQGLGIFHEFRTNMEKIVPLVAIGGINSSNAEHVMKSGADGLCFVSEICAAPSIVEKTKELHQIIMTSQSTI